MVHQKVLDDANVAKYDLDYNSFDAAGNLLRYTMTNHTGTAYTNTYTTAYTRMEGYKEKTISGSSTVLQGGTTTQAYDANGYLVGITDSTLGAKNRTFVNDAAGRALMVNQGGNIQRQLIVNGEVLGRYGTMVDDKNPQTQGTPNFVTKADFNFSFKPIDGTYPRATPSAVTVAPGDTLQNIAKNVYGDSALWYLIADANGLSGNADLTVGQALNIPSRVSSASGANTFTPYNASKVIGDTSPNLPQPAPQAQGGGGGGCGGLGAILMIVVLVVITVYTAGAMTGVAAQGFAATMSAGMGVMTGGVAVGATGLAGALGTVGTLAVASAAGSIGSQLFGMAIGAQKDFNWNQVGLAALGGAISGGMIGAWGPASGASSWALAGRAALSTGLSQGIGDQLGMGVKFSWTNVALAAASSGVNSAMKTYSPFKANDLFNNSMNGFVSGMTMNALRGGQMTPGQVATDAFGNALAESIKDDLSKPSQQEDVLGKFIQEKLVAQQQREQSAALYGLTYGNGSGADGMGGGTGVTLAGAKGPGLSYGGVHAPQVAQDEQLDGGRNDVNGMDLDSDQYRGNRRTAVVKDGQGALAALADLGLNDAQRRAALGYLVRTGQIGEDGVVQPGQELHIDTDDRSNAKLGGRVIAQENDRKDNAAIALLKGRSLQDYTQADRDADPNYRLARNGTGGRNRLAGTTDLADEYTRGVSRDPDGAFVAATARELRGDTNNALALAATQRLVDTRPEVFASLARKGAGATSFGDAHEDTHDNNSFAGIKYPEENIINFKDPSAHRYGVLTYMGPVDKSKGITLDFLVNDVIRERTSYPGKRMADGKANFQGISHVYAVRIPMALALGETALNDPSYYTTRIGDIRQMEVPNGVLNVTTTDHMVYPGTIRRTGIEVNGGLYIYTSGAGINRLYNTDLAPAELTNKLAWGNDHYGAMAFRTLDQKAVQYINKIRQGN